MRDEKRLREYLRKYDYSIIDYRKHPLERMNPREIESQLDSMVEWVEEKEISYEYHSFSPDKLKVEDYMPKNIVDLENFYDGEIEIVPEGTTHINHLPVAYKLIEENLADAVPFSIFSKESKEYHRYHLTEKEICRASLPAREILTEFYMGAVIPDVVSCDRVDISNNNLPISSVEICVELNKTELRKVDIYLNRFDNTREVWFVSTPSYEDKEYEYISFYND